VRRHPDQCPSPPGAVIAAIAQPSPVTVRVVIRRYTPCSCGGASVATLGLPWTPPAASCEARLGFFRSTVRPEYRDVDGAMFGPELSVPDASACDRLLAFAGRKAS
jgi:hypothetical protein